MLKRFEKILSLYEDFSVHKGALSGGEGFFDYMAPSSLHSDITCFAYGIRKTMSCLDIRRNPAQSLVTLTRETLGRRFYVKLTASLFHWQSFVCGIEITVNGKIAYENSREFFENVNIGWPTIYIPVDGKLLKEGENIVVLKQTGGDTALLVSCLDLVSLPMPEFGQQVGFCSVARKHSPFAVSFFTQDAPVEVVSEAGCRVLEILPFEEETLVKLEAWEAPQARLQIGDVTVEVLMPELAEASEDVCLVGTDSDDHRHDDSDETSRILKIITNTAMGDFWQARPNRGRNFQDLAPQECWEKYVERLKFFGVRISQADFRNAMTWLRELSGEHYIGRHFHEAYLYFCAALERSQEFVELFHINFPALRASESFGQSKEMFITSLRKMYESCQDSPGMTAVGSPSLLTVYEAKAGFERVTIEPVSNIPLLIGAVRGAAPKMWGAHVPTDWYFGEPNDEVKSRKFMLAMQILYLGGADYVYAENDLFKTNAFSREDWEDPFCALNRKYQREFYAYKQKNPREGQLQKDLAVIYGNNEFFLWHHDDRIAELPENNDWDQKLWGKWEDNRHHKLWRTVDAWLPLVKDQHSKKNVLNLDLFSGTPYGAVDIIDYEDDYRKYKAVALLGWNTCIDGFGQKLRDYVTNGGHAFVSRCHFNRTDRCDLPFAYDEEQIDLLLEGGETVPFYADAEGNTLVWKIRLGQGTLYFGEFEDYTATPIRMQAMKETLRALGEENAQAVCDNPNIYFTLRKDEDGKQSIHALNVCANGSEEEFTIRLAGGQKLRGKAAPCEIQIL